MACIRRIWLCSLCNSVLRVVGVLGAVRRSEHPPWMTMVYIPSLLNSYHFPDVTEDHTDDDFRQGCSKEIWNKAHALRNKKLWVHTMQNHDPGIRGWTEVGKKKKEEESDYRNRTYLQLSMQTPCRFPCWISIWHCCSCTSLLVSAWTLEGGIWDASSAIQMCPPPKATGLHPESFWNFHPPSP